MFNENKYINIIVRITSLIRNLNDEIEGSFFSLKKQEKIFNKTQEEIEIHSKVLKILNDGLKNSNFSSEEINQNIQRQKDIIRKLQVKQHHNIENIKLSIQRLTYQHNSIEKLFMKKNDDSSNNFIMDES